MTLEVTAKNPAFTQCSAWHTEDTKTEVLNKYSQCFWGVYNIVRKHKERKGEFYQKMGKVSGKTAEKRQLFS